MIQLDKLQKGESGIVVGFARDGRITRRLMDLGLVLGRKVTHVRSAPLRDPMQVRIGQCRLTIRRAEASLIQLELEANKVVER